MNSETKMPPHPSKRGSLFIVPDSIRPQLVRTGIEVCLLLFIKNINGFHF